MRINNTRKSNTYSIIAWCSLSAARQNMRRPPGRTSPPPGARPLPDPLFYGYRLAEHTLPPSATHCRAHPW